VAWSSPEWHRRADAVRLVAYLDAFVPGDGQAVADLVSPEFRELIRLPEQQGEGRFPYPEALWPPEGSLPEAARASYIGRMPPHPVRTMTEADHARVDAAARG
jgi:hypothetical protein